MNNDLIINDTEKIEDLIFEIRNVQVMLDKDVAKLYQVETRRVNEVVKRNINRFPDTFCFQLNKTDMKQMCSRSQNAILNNKNSLRGSNYKYAPYVFTEYGIMMLSGLLKSDIAAQINKRIIIAFVEVKKLLSSNLFKERLSNVETKLIEHDNKLNEVLIRIDNKTNNYIFFEGQYLMHILK